VELHGDVGVEPGNTPGAPVSPWVWVVGIALVVIALRGETIGQDLQRRPLGRRR